MATGTVKFFNGAKGYGFIVPDDGGGDVFVHIKDVERSRIGALSEGQRLSYEIQPGPDGRSTATDLKLVGVTSVFTSKPVSPNT